MLQLREYQYTDYSVHKDQYHRIWSLSLSLFLFPLFSHKVTVTQVILFFPKH